MYVPPLTKGLSNQEPSPVGAETKKKGCYPFFDVFSTAGTWFLTTEWEAKNRSANAFRGSRRLTDEVYFYILLWGGPTSSTVRRRAHRITESILVYAVSFIHIQKGKKRCITPI